jgi:hypothetical protein
MRDVDRVRKVNRWTGVTMRPTALVAVGALSLGGLVAATASGSQAQQSVVPAAARTDTDHERDTRSDPNDRYCLGQDGEPEPCYTYVPKKPKQFNRRFVQRKYGVVNSPRWLKNVRHQHYRKLHPWYFDGQAMRLCWLIDPRGGRWEGNRVCRDGRPKRGDFLRQLGEDAWDYGVACGAGALVTMRWTRRGTQDPRAAIGAGAAGCVGGLVVDIVRDINPFDRTATIAEQRAAGRVNIRWKIRNDRVWSKYPGKRWRKR